MKSGRVINVNNDDSRAWKYYALWNAGSLVKAKAKIYLKAWYKYIIL